MPTQSIGAGGKLTSQNLHIGPDAAADRYRLLRSIGRGGEAVLYLAEIELAGGSEPVVVKVLDSKTTITPDDFDRISRRWNEQAELLRFVHRPGVVGVREHFEGPPIHRSGESGTLTGRALVLVMNHVDGLDLRDWRAERNLATAAERREVMRTLEQLADVLDWLHSGKATPSGRQVIHGDLSPGNVMVDGHGQATLVDFGLSKLTADHQTAEVWFTPGYAAPEVFDGKRTPAADRYAFGAIAYFLLSGESPPNSPDQLARAMAALPQIAALDAERRARITAVHAADPTQRPVSLAGWMKDVRHAVVSTTSSTSRRAVQDAVPAPLPAKPALPPQPASPPPAHTPAPVPPAPTTEDAHQQPPVQPRPEHVPAGYGPTYPLHESPPPGPAAPTRRRAGIVLGSVAAVLVIAALAVLGVRLLGDDKGGDQAADGKGGSSASDPATPQEETPTPSPSPSESESGSTDTGTTPEPTASGTQPGGVAPDIKAADLTLLTPIAGLGNFTVGAAKINTKQYGAAFIAQPDCNDEAITEFDLNREWKHLEFTAGIDDGSTHEKGRVSISLDGKPAAFSELVELGKPATRSVDVTGALRLRVKVDMGCDNGTVVVAAPQLTR
ncbi:serine/threonine protein kinase [Streptomyces vinaceus]|uniref:non-specific serine/threonine protein kinase n=1 Tax=Streptomyces vinaceus TaxID=1960 RepID=A0A5J6J2G8_STRVI|nr:serine/threonine protein kinase [Streptomyces vinaceus]